MKRSVHRFSGFLLLFLTLLLGCGGRPEPPSSAETPPAPADPQPARPEPGKKAPRNGPTAVTPTSAY